MTQSKPQPPIKEFRAGAISASLWRKEVEQNGKTVIQHSIRIQKRYRDKEGNWQNSEYFFPSELPRVALLVQKAYEYVTLNGTAEEGVQPD